MPGIFLGLKFQACVCFWVCNMKLRRTPHHVYFEWPPWEASELRKCLIMPYFLKYKMKRKQEALRSGTYKSSNVPLFSCSVATI